jgi:hypothetical protein
VPVEAGLEQLRRRRLPSGTDAAGVRRYRRAGEAEARLIQRLGRGVLELLELEGGEEPLRLRLARSPARSASFFVSNHVLGRSADCERADVWINGRYINPVSSMYRSLDLVWTSRTSLRTYSRTASARPHRRPTSRPRRS